MGEPDEDEDGDAGQGDSLARRPDVVEDRESAWRVVSAVRETVWPPGHRLAVMVPRYAGDRWTCFTFVPPGKSPVSRKPYRDPGPAAPGGWIVLSANDRMRGAPAIMRSILDAFRAARKSEPVWRGEGRRSGPPAGRAPVGPLARRGGRP